MGVGRLEGDVIGFQIYVWNPCPHEKSAARDGRDPTSDEYVQTRSLLALGSFGFFSHFLPYVGTKLASGFLEERKPPLSGGLRKSGLQFFLLLIAERGLEGLRLVLRQPRRNLILDNFADQKKNSRTTRFDRAPERFDQLVI
jgi:hypothetical protein